MTFTFVGLAEKMAVIVLAGTFVVMFSEPELESPVRVAVRLIELNIPASGGGS